MNPAASLPAVHISTRDLGAIAACSAQLRRTGNRALARFLAAELARAHIRAESEIPATSVVLDARILVRADTDRPPEVRVLVVPERYVPSGQFLSLASPVGVAVLGIEVGNPMPYMDRQGNARHAIVDGILYRPPIRAAAAPPLRPATARQAGNGNVISLHAYRRRFGTSPTSDDPDPSPAA